LLYELGRDRNGKETAEDKDIDGLLKTAASRGVLRRR
jgi:hypothetical protein